MRVGKYTRNPCGLRVHINTHKVCILVYVSHKCE